jgi:hypothetical protein
MMGVVAVAYDRVQEWDQDDHSAFDQKKRLDSQAETVGGEADEESYREGKGHEEPDVVENSD